MNEAAPGDGVLTEFTATVVFERYADIRAALFDPNLSRSFDKRSYEHGNIRDGVVSITHGATHRARRRVENTQFRADALRLYERELFPKVMNELLDVLIDQEHVDLFQIGEMLSVVLAARRAGIDHDAGSLDQLRALVHHVDVLSQGSAILDAKEPDRVRLLVRQTYAELERDFMAASRQTRQALIARVRGGELAEAELPQDILTVLLLHAEDPSLALNDGRILREVATYLQGGTHTSAQTLVNCVDLVFARDDARGLVDRIAADLLLAQRVVLETLRLRPTTPKMKRRAEAETEIGGVHIPKDAQVILDVTSGNRDPLFGARPDDFDPDRTIDPNVARWGLSFGAGAHQCPGRSVGGGFPVPGTFEVDGDHVFGLVALELQAVAQRGVSPDPDAAPERDLRTERFTRWLHYPVRFPVAP